MDTVATTSASVLVSGALPLPKSGGMAWSEVDAFAA